MARHRTLESALRTCSRKMCRRVDLAGVSLQSTIPTEIGAVRGVTELDLHSTGVHGSIPTELGRLTQVTFLYLYANALVGTIPTEIAGLQALKRMRVGSNPELCTRPTSQLPTALLPRQLPPCPPPPPPAPPHPPSPVPISALPPAGTGSSPQDQQRLTRAFLGLGLACALAGSVLCAALAVRHWRLLRPSSTIGNRRLGDEPLDEQNDELLIDEGGAS